MASPAVEQFVIDEANIDKFAMHGVTDDQVLQVLDDDFLVARNKGQERASHLVVGYDYGGTCLTIPIEATAGDLVWRPVTAWRSTREERARRDRARRRR